MKNIKTLLTVFTLLLVKSIFGQIPSTCVNSDFELGDFTGWLGQTGSCCPIATSPSGIVTGRHTIMTGPGTDPNTCNIVTVVAPGGTYSARLGNDNTGSEAEKLTYTINVTASNALFIYKYAVVLEDPSHLPQEQPRFELNILNASGQLIDPVCGQYTVVSGGSIPGFQTCNGSIRYKDWTTVGLDLTPYIGQTLTIEFATGDCSLGGHFGYAYVDAFCSPLMISTAYCTGSFSAVLTAPLGFSYLWSTGATTQSINVNNPQNGQVYNCQLTSVTGCIVNISTILFPVDPLASFALTNTCYNNAVFSNTSFTPPNTYFTSYDWDFGDGSPHDTTANPSHNYATIGTYTVTFTVGNNAGCTSTITQTISANPVPPLIVTPSHTICNFEVDTLYANLGPNFTWSAGVTLINDSTVSVAPHTTTTYTVTTNLNGCYVNQTTTVNVTPIPVVSVVPSFTLCNAANHAASSFVVNPANAALSWTNTNITIGVGVNGNGNVPAFTATNTTTNITSGIITVSSFLNGCAGNNVTYTISVVPSPAVVVTPTVGVCKGSVAPSPAVTLVPPSATITWANSNSGIGLGASGSGVPPSFTATNASSSNIFASVLITPTANGCNGTPSTYSITVYPLPNPAFSVTNVCLHNTSAFNVTSTTNIQGYQWNFGDGSPLDISTNPTHTYSANGTYNAQLIITSNDNCINTLNQNVMVYPLPVAQFSAPDVCEGFNTVFNNSSTIAIPDNIAEWYWNFGDNSAIDNTQLPTHIYQSSGTFTVKLSTVSNHGCLDSISNPVTVNPNPVVDFMPDGNACSPLCINFQDLTTILTGANQSWMWTFGNGDSSAIQNPFHCYYNNTIYAPLLNTVKLTVTSDQGCVKSLTKPDYITVNPIPVADFTFTPNPASILAPTIFFDNLSLGGTTWLWNMGDSQPNSISTDKRLDYKYTNAGNYQVTLIATNSYNCKDTVIRTIIINDDWAIFIPNAFTPNADNLNSFFTAYGYGIVNFEMTIFDRWGTVMYQTDDMAKGWDGRVKGKSEPVQQDVYVYKINVTDYKKEDHKYIGSVTIVR